MYPIVCRECGYARLDEGDRSNGCAQCGSSNGDRQPAILNLTQHAASNEQHLDGVVDWQYAKSSHLAWLERDDFADPQDFDARLPDDLKDMLTFNAPTTWVHKKDRAAKLAYWVKEMGYKAAMVGGKASFVVALAEELIELGILPVESFSRRESMEKTLPFGSVRKVNVLKHAGFDAILPGAKLSLDANNKILNTLAEIKLYKK